MSKRSLAGECNGTFFNEKVGMGRFFILNKDLC